MYFCEITSSRCADGCSGDQLHDDVAMLARLNRYYEDRENYTKCLGCQTWTHCDDVNLDNIDYCDRCELPPASPSATQGYVNGVFQRGDEAAGKSDYRYECYQEHDLVRFTTPDVSFTCDLCAEQQSMGAEMFGCQECDYDLCENCQ